MKVKRTFKKPAQLSNSDDDEVPLINSESPVVVCETNSVSAVSV